MMFGADGIVLYVGKARNLRKRVNSYFGNTDSRPQVRFLMARVTEIQFTVTDTEKEALLLENTLIKQYKPRYNLSLKDDKTFFSLRIELKSPFPRFTVVRKTPRDGARYFGPYASPGAARELLRQLQRMFPLRHYPLKTCMSRQRPCLYHQIGQCCAPCQNLVSAGEYASLVEGAILFMEGKSRDLVKRFRQKMQNAASEMRYEEAARWRDLLKSVDATLERQKMVTRVGDADVIGLARRDEKLAVAVLFVRNGAVTGSTAMHGSGELEMTDSLSSFIQSYYSSDVNIPEELLLPFDLDDRNPLEEWLGELRGKKVRLHHPVRGEKAALSELAVRNAEAALLEKTAADSSARTVLEELQSRLALSALPARIECYDISTLQGRHSVGSGVTFIDGVPAREHYRRYRIREIAGQDDFAMLKEVFSRRFSPKRIEEWGVPDLIVVDGGKGQLGSTLAALKEIAPERSFTVISLAKSRVERNSRGSRIDKSEERVFLPGRVNPLKLRQDSAPLKLLAAIRDEAHRFAIEYHRKLRSRDNLRSVLRDIPGIGIKRERLLLRYFGSLENIRKAEISEISSVGGIDQALAESIKNSGI